MKNLQCLILFLLLCTPSLSLALWRTEPYLGYGQLSLQLGDAALINGESIGYNVGARTGIELSSNLYLAADYTRAGPYTVKFKNQYYGVSIDSGYFTLYSAGVGLEASLGSWNFYYGQYPYHTLEEHKIDFQMKGTMNRMGIGLDLDSKAKITFVYESSTLDMKNPTGTVSSILCYNTPIEDCKTSGTSHSLYFVISAPIR